MKDIVIQYSAKLVDKINQIQEDAVISTASVNDKWRVAVKKVQIGKADADDGNFPDKILNGKTAGGSSGDDDKKPLIDE